MYKCPVCGKTYKRRQYYEKHLIKEHGWISLSRTISLAYTNSVKGSVVLEKLTEILARRLNLVIVEKDSFYILVSRDNKLEIILRERSVSIGTCLMEPEEAYKLVEHVVKTIGEALEEAITSIIDKQYEEDSRKLLKVCKEYSADVCEYIDHNRRIILVGVKNLPFIVLHDVVSNHAILLTKTTYKNLVKKVKELWGKDFHKER